MSELGGKRLGDGGKLETHDQTFERSNHDLSRNLLTTMGVGTLVPTLVLPMMPGDTFDIELDEGLNTLPTLGALYGSFKLQRDVFKIPMRLYHRDMLIDKLETGLNMDKVKLPLIRMDTALYNPSRYIDLDNGDINASSIYNYLGIRGIAGTIEQTLTTSPSRDFNAIPLLAYGDIFKNYYSNKQEDTAYIIHNSFAQNALGIQDCYALTYFLGGGNPQQITFSPTTAHGASNPPTTEVTTLQTSGDYLTEFVLEVNREFKPQALKLFWSDTYNGNFQEITADKIFASWEYDQVQGTMTGRIKKVPDQIWFWTKYRFDAPQEWAYEVEPQLQPFLLKEIDLVKDALLTHSTSTPFIINDQTSLYGFGLTEYNNGVESLFARRSNQEGLFVKTYQSDIFNNYLKESTIIGTNGVNDISSVQVDTTSGKFSIDDLNLSEKLYKMFNNIANSGGKFTDYIRVNYNNSPYLGQMIPTYEGGTSREIVFQEILSTAETKEKPQGNIIGKGITQNKQGGYVTVRADEPCYLMCIASITPRLNYSQGNEWHTSIKTMSEWHLPHLDQIGFQDLITDNMAFWDSLLQNNGNLITNSAGKQPAWIQYTTNYDKVAGNFCKITDLGFMIIDRRYQRSKYHIGSGEYYIKDRTTYIDPKLYNYMFADSRRDAQNFTVHFGHKIHARRVMSASLMPNL